jgi:cysteine desulfurase
MNKADIYLDNAATTPIDETVQQLINKTNRVFYGNPSSLHKQGRLVKEQIEEARIKVASVLNAKPDEIIFTGSGTESDNLAILGVARANKQYGKHIIISAIEHKAVLESVTRLKEEGFSVSYAPVDKEGITDVNELRKLIRKDTILVSIMYANNEIGTIQPIHEITKIITPFKEKTGYPLFHTDACQAAGALSLDTQKLGVDLLTLNGSKIYGPKGVGCLYIRQKCPLQPQIIGGDQENHKRAGTENVSLVVALTKALDIAISKQEAENIRQTKLRDYLINKIQKSIPETRLNGHLTKRLPNNINFSFVGIEGESLVLLLDQAKIYCSTGSACSSLDLYPSYVLLAIGLTPELAYGSLRITLGRKTTQKDLDITVSELTRIVSHLRKISAIKTYDKKQ